ncbi:MAG: hypothetical protein WC054_00290 [Candidatus Nanopelagicales bacterium]
MTNIEELRDRDDFWALYQDFRTRNKVAESPSRVPVWYLTQLARTRVATARVDLERVGSPNGEAAFNALRTLEDFLRGSGNDAEVQVIVSALLGAGEFVRDPDPDMCAEGPHQAGSLRADGCAQCELDFDVWFFDSVLRSMWLGARKPGSSHRVQVVKAIRQTIIDGGLPGWERRLPAVTRAWGGSVVEGDNNKLALSIRLLIAWTDKEGVS